MPGTHQASQRERNCSPSGNLGTSSQCCQSVERGGGHSIQEAEFYFAAGVQLQLQLLAGNSGAILFQNDSILLDVAAFLGFDLSFVRNVTL